MKQIAWIALTICCLASAAYGQVAPAATSSGATSTARGLQYAFRYSQSALLSDQFSTIQTSTVSGSVAYANRSQEKPFDMTYAAGYNWGLSGGDYQTGQFHHMYLSQGINSRRWKLLLSDNVSYLPQSPTTGFSGIPGIGEIIGITNPNPPTSQTILTTNTHVLNNTAQGELEHTLDYATTAAIGGSSDILHFPDGNGFDTRSISANGRIGRRLSGRTSLSGVYAFSQYEYPGTTVAIHTSRVLVGVERRLTRNLSMNLAAGPEWIDSTVTAIIPANLSYAVNAGMYYMRRSTTSLGATYFHGINGGGGYLLGASADTVVGDFFHQIGPNLTFGLTGGYRRTAALNTNGVTNASYGGAQATWRLVRNVIVFANYSGTGQSTSSLLPGNTLNQTLHTISFGFGISSREPRLRP
jgi:hypothetical protein